MADGPKTPMAAELVPYELLYPANEAQKAAKLVQEEIPEHQKQLDRLRLFATDNIELINLVRRLPEELTHEIMVPFGKAAFFPGRLIHTNEFLVLLGEGHYADQTAKQTVEVLKRRGLVLETKVEALNAMISDLQARARFYDMTANESGEGMVEIREYEELLPKTKDDTASVVSTEEGKMKITITDDEYAKVLVGLDELEKAELAAENASNDNEDEKGKAQKFAEQEQHDNHRHNISEDKHIKNPEQKPKDEVIPHITIAQQSGKLHELSCSENSKLLLGDGGSYSEADAKTYPGCEFGPKDDSPLEFSQPSGSSSLSTTEGKALEKPLQRDKNPAQNTVNEIATTGYGHRKAFTGTVIEHDTGLAPKLSSSQKSQATTANPTKPVSRFKLRKGN